MATKLSKNRQHLYFPIDWWNKPVTTRALGYFLGREHSTLVHQLARLRFKLVRSEVHHVNPKFSVWCYELTPEQVVKYVKKYSPHMFTQLPQSYQEIETDENSGSKNCV